jgi:hypothetical protein
VKSDQIRLLWLQVGRVLYLPEIRRTQTDWVGLRYEAAHRTFSRNLYVILSYHIMFLKRGELLWNCRLGHGEAVVQL